MSRLLPVAALSAAALLGVAGGSTAAGNPQGFYVVFHADHTITMTLADGTPVGTRNGVASVVPPGKWDVSMDDSASVSGPQFDLTGPGVSFVDNMFLGEDPSETFTVTLLPSSTYTWRNDETPTIVFTFTTSATGGTTATTPAPAATTTPVKTNTTTSSGVVGSQVVPFRGTLQATVAANGKLSLDRSGKTVLTLKAGRYTVSVNDVSEKSGFSLQQLHHTALKLTSAVFVGKHSASVTLKSGQWLFYSTSAHKSYFIVVG